jgi:hypothetical protein
MAVKGMMEIGEGNEHLDVIHNLYRFQGKMKKI